MIVKYLALGTLCLLICGCGKNGEGADYQSSGYPLQTVYSTPAEAPSASAPIAPQRPAHNYDAMDGVLYSYIAAVSEDERKEGVAAGDAYTFAYLGKREGKHVLVRVTADGRPLEEAYCGTPCRVITYANGRQLGFNEGSIIGAAFADAIAGRLEIAVYGPRPEPSPAPSAPPPAVPPVKPTPRNTDQMLLWLDAHDKCRWSTDEQERQQGCLARDRNYGPTLVADGYCFGKQGEAASNRMLHRCEAGSLPLPSLLRDE
jgi:hypothetical protein